MKRNARLAAAMLTSALVLGLGGCAAPDFNRSLYSLNQPVVERTHYMLDVAASIVECALMRTESRGAHQRTDFPSRDDDNFLAHSLIYRNEDGSSRIEYLPVTITRWPPADRVYGK